MNFKYKNYLFVHGKYQIWTVAPSTTKLSKSRDWIRVIRAWLKQREPSLLRPRIPTWSVKRAQEPTTNIWMWPSHRHTRTSSHPYRPRSSQMSPSNPRSIIRGRTGICKTSPKVPFQGRRLKCNRTACIHSRLACLRIGGAEAYNPLPK